MINFKLNCSTGKMECWDNNKMVADFVFAEPVKACNVYLKHYIYRRVKALILARKLAYGHGETYTPKIEKCDYMLDKIHRSYNQSNLLSVLGDLLKFEIGEIAPHPQSRFFNGFLRKRDDLIETISYYLKDTIKMYTVVNQSH